MNAFRIDPEAIYFIDKIFGFMHLYKIKMQKKIK
jgi:hypothetical protein